MPKFEFYGTAIVSVAAYVEAESYEEAQSAVDNGDVTWECEVVDGDVENIECMNPDEKPE